MLLKRIFQMMLVILLPGLLAAQVTTSSITGSVRTPEQKPLDGATIIATHLPTGSVYRTVSNSQGQYTLPNLRVGGPYTLVATYTGYEKLSITDIYIALGTPLNMDLSLTNASANLENVTVSGRKGSVINSLRNGTSTTISLRQIQNLPSISRSIQDYARLMPQAKVGNSASTGDGAGISFGGQNNRYNQFSVDGANATDGFGLGSTGTNGGQANVNPISMESIQEIQMVMSPYDITQGGFTGGGINAVTKSGTNTFHGSAYWQYQNQNYVGKSVGYNDAITRSKYQDFKNYTFGASLGGPIIKDKLFFFANYERHVKSLPLAYDPTDPGSGSFVNVKTMDSIRNYLISTYNYDPGTYGAINSEQKSNIVFARIDWNISDKNKLAIRYNHTDGTSDNISRTAYSSVFSNGGFLYRNKSNSFVAELNSSFSSTASNVLRVTYNAIRDNHGSNAPFPSVTIYQTNADNATNITYNIGTNYSYHANGLKQDVFTLTDNLTLYKTNHTITFGTYNEFYNSNNIFLQNYYGSYYYGTTSTYGNPNVQNFFDNKGLSSYYVGYSTSSVPGDKAPAILHAAQFSVYGQDVWSVKDNFKLTYGLRIDLPAFFNKPAYNDTFPNYFAGYSTSTMPKVTPMFSPRIGFNWDVNKNAQTQVRGGIGLFTGRAPYVWISNQISNTGVASMSYSTSNAATIEGNGIKFNYDPSKANFGAYIPDAGTAATAINLIDRKFKFPQVLRGNIAIDQKLPLWGLVGTMEFAYTKTLNNSYYKNLNLSENGDGTVDLGADSRPLWTGRLTNKYSDVIYLTNTSKGYSYTATAQLQKPYDKGWSGSIAYTYGHSVSLSDMTSSVALSNWRYVVNANGLNNLDMATSNYNLGSRVVGYLSKEFRYAKNLATNFTLIYTGQSGQRISYVYSYNVLGDDRSNTSYAYDLIYIPKSRDEINLVDIVTSTGTVTASQQWEDFQKFANDNKYFKENQGKVAKRNGGSLPWENHFDFRIAQDFIFGKNKLQVFFDILNVGNLLNKKWGWSYGTSSTSDGLYTLTKSVFTGVTSGARTVDGVTTATPTTAKPAFQFNINNMTNVDGTYRPYAVSDFMSRWNSQIGIKYTF